MLPSEKQFMIINVHSTLQVVTILVAMAPNILELATWFRK